MPKDISYSDSCEHARHCAQDRGTTLEQLMTLTRDAQIRARSFETRHCPRIHPGNEPQISCLQVRRTAKTSRVLDIFLSAADDGARRPTR
jgi:hypothetical protein